MKKIIIVLCILFPLMSISQKRFQCKVKYDWKASSENFKNEVINDPKMDIKMRFFLEERMKKMFNKTFLLQIDNDYSRYDEEILASINDVAPDLSGIYPDISYYRDLKEKKIIIQREFNGKNFFIKDSLSSFNWILVNETKIIGDYLCYKAKTKVKIANEENDSISNKQSTNFFKEKDQEFEIVAWYCLDIPICQGPSSFWGLPGLILEIYDNNYSIRCSELIINPKKKIKIIFPKKNKLISKNLYDKLVLKKNKELENE